MTIPERKYPDHCFVMEDWDNPDERTPYTLEQMRDGVHVQFPEKDAAIWIEYQDGYIRVHCYHEDRDEPFNVDIHRDRFDTYHN